MKYIIDPETSQKININTEKGLYILKKYINVYKKNKKQKGGVNDFIRSLFPWSSSAVIFENFNKDVKNLTKQKEEIEKKIELMKEKYNYWSEPIKGNIIGPHFISVFNIKGKKICLFGEQHYSVSENIKKIKKLPERVWFHTILNKLWNKSVSSNKCLDLYFEVNYTKKEKDNYNESKRRMQQYLLNKIKFKNVVDTDPINTNTNTNTNPNLTNVTTNWNIDKKFELYPKQTFQDLIKPKYEKGTEYIRSINNKNRIREYGQTPATWSRLYINNLRSELSKIRNNFINNIRIHNFDLREYFNNSKYFNPFIHFYGSDCSEFDKEENKIRIVSIKDENLGIDINLNNIENPQYISIDVLNKFANTNNLFEGTPFNSKQDLKKWIIFYCGNFNNSINDELYLSNMNNFFKTLYEYDSNDENQFDCTYMDYNDKNVTKKCKLLNTKNKEYFSIDNFKTIRNYLIKMFQKSSFKNNPGLLEKCIDNLVDHFWDTKKLTNDIDIIFMITILYHFIFTDVYAFLRMFISWNNDETSNLTWDNFIDGCKVNFQNNIIHYAGSEHSHNLNVLLKGIVEPIFYKEVDDNNFITIENDLYLF